jgi:hypothetical protein
MIKITSLEFTTLLCFGLAFLDKNAGNLFEHQHFTAQPYTGGTPTQVLQNNIIVAIFR